MSRSTENTKLKYQSKSFWKKPLDLIKFRGQFGELGKELDGKVGGKEMVPRLEQQSISRALSYFDGTHIRVAAKAQLPAKKAAKRLSTECGRHTLGEMDCDPS